MTSAHKDMSQMTMPEALISVHGHDLSVERGGLRLFRPISFSLTHGGAILIEGRNGIGKTSLLKALGGLAPLADGTVTAEGLTETSLLEHLHHLGHDNGLRPQLSARESASFYRDYFQGGGDMAEVFATLGLAGLEDIPSGYLSAGQKRKLAISRLLLSHRPLWLLDEPLNALDVHSQALVHRLIEQHRASGGMVIAVSHGSLIMPGAQRIELDDRLEASA